MARKPRCPVCHSKRWHRDGLSGSIVCEEGHLLQGYVQESNEAHEFSQHVTQTRRLRKQRTKKVKPLPNHYFHGERGTFILWQALQWVLREQLRVLIEELGWPVELEGICRDLWGMLMASSGVPNAPGDYFKGDEPATSFCGPREGVRYSRRRTNQAKTEWDEEESGAREGGQSEGERGGSGSDADDSDSFVSSDEGAEAEDEARPRKRARTTSPAPQNDGPPPPPVNLYDEIKPPPLAEQKPRSTNPRAQPRMEHLLLIIYLGCVTLRLPTFMNDILNLVETHQILYINAKNHLPLSLQQHLASEARYLLDPQSTPSLYSKTQHDALQASLQHLVKMYTDDWGVRFPEPNLPLMSWRLCRSLALPPIFYSHLKSLLSLLSPSFSLAPHPPLRAGRKGETLTKGHPFVEPPEFVLLAGLVLVCKMIWDLEEEPRVPRDEEDLLAHLPPMEEWLKTVGDIAKIEKERDPASLWSKEVADMTTTEIDAYLDFFEDKVVPEHQFPSRMKDIDRFFPAPALPSRPSALDLAPFSNRIDALITQLYSLPPPAPSPSETTTSSAPHHYVHHSASLVSTLPTPLASLLHHASTLVGTTPFTLLTTLSRLEERVAPTLRESKRLTAAQHRAIREEREEIEEWREERWEKEVERRKELRALTDRAIKAKGVKKGEAEGEMGRASPTPAIGARSGTPFKSKEFIDDSDEE